MPESILAEAVTCKWVNGYADHGPQVTDFGIGEKVLAYSEIHAPDMYGKVVKHEWWYKKAGESEFTKRWEYIWDPIDGHYTGYANWTYWDIGSRYGAGTGYVKIFVDGRYLGRTNDYTVRCAEGTRETLETCWDGSVKRERVCENGKWRYYDHICPEKCTEGEEDVLEWCPDGHSPKRVRVCRNGRWVEEDYTCPECYPEESEEILEYCEYGGGVKRKRVCRVGKWVYYDFTCPECNEGEEEILEYCEYGEGVKRKRICENGRWVEYTYMCPGERGWLMEKIQGIFNRFLG